MRPSQIRRWYRSVVLTAATAALVPFGLAAAGQAPAEKPAAAPPQAKVKVDPVGDQKLDQLINLARDEMEVMKAQLDAQRALLQIGEARLIQAKAWHERYKVLRHEGKVTDERVMSAKDDVLMLEAHVAGERADVKLAEVRIKQAQRRLDYGEFPDNPVDSRLADIEHRMSSMELKFDRIQHEVGKLRRELPYVDR